MSATVHHLVPPPHDLDAEGAVLSACLLEADALGRVRGLVAPTHFYAPANRRIYEACLALADAGRPLDSVTVASWLKSRNQIAEVGGVAYLARIVDAVPSVANLEAYARIVREKAAARQLLRAAQQLGADARTPASSVRDLTSAFRKRLDAIEAEADAEDTLPMVDASSLAAPLPKVAWLCEGLGLAPGRPVLLSGYGGIGKTLLAQQLALAVASGQPSVWGGIALQASGPVVHIDYEQTLFITRWRYQRIAYAMHLDLGGLAERLGVVSLPPLYLTDPRAEAELSRVCQGRTLCLLDNLRAACPAVEENSSAIRVYLDVLTRVTERTGCLFLVIVHEGKQSAHERPGLQRVRGSSAISDAASAVISFRCAQELIRIEHTKSSLGRLGEPSYIRLLDEGPLDPNTKKSQGLRIDWVPREQAAELVEEATTCPPAVEKAKRGLVETLRKHGPMPKNELLDRTVGKAGPKREAMREILNEGVVTYAPGPRGAKVCQLASLPSDPPPSSRGQG